MSQDIRVLYLSYDGLTDPLGQSQILPYIIGLAERGVYFTVVTFEKKSRFSEEESKVKALIDPYKNIQWVPLKYHKNPPVISTIYDVWSLRLSASKLVLEHKLNIVHCRSYITALVGLSLQRKLGLKFIFDMRGFWADERVEGGLWNLRNPLFKIVYNYFKRKEIQFLQQADHIISLTRNAKNEIENWKMKTAPVSIIPTCVDLNAFDPTKVTLQEKTDLKVKLGFSDSDRILVYLGSWGTWYLTNEMLMWFDKLKSAGKVTKFLIVSTDVVDTRMSAFTDEVVVTKARRNEVKTYLSISDVAICFVKPSFSKKASSATKIGEFLAMNIPVIINRGWGDVDLMKEHFGESIVLVDPFFGGQINLPVAHPDVREKVSTMLGLTNGIKSYYDIYTKLVK